MRWVAWRQHRVEVTMVAAAALLLAALLTAQGLALSAAPDRRPPGWTAGPIQFEVFGLILVPAVLGMWLGAPLVAREVERGTHRLAWTQGVSRGRWLLVKLALLLGAVVAAMAAAGVLMYLTLRPGPSDGLPNVFDTGTFDAVGIVPLAYGAFALALGVWLSTLLRRTLIAMFLVLLLFVALRGSVTAFARPNYEPPLRQTVPISAIPNGGRVPTPAGAHVVDSAVTDRSGHPWPAGSGPRCRSLAECNRLTFVTTYYQPGDRFWTFQMIEGGLYLALAALLLGLAYRRVVRTLS